MAAVSTRTANLGLLVNYRLYSDNAVEWTYLGQLLPMDHVDGDGFVSSNDNKFGNSAMIHTTEAQNVIMASSYLADFPVKVDGVTSTATDAGAVYIFQGRMGKVESATKNNTGQCCRYK